MQRGLERDPAGVEGDRLADEPEDEVGTCRRRRVVAQHHQARRVVASLRDRRECAHALRANLVRPERFRGQVLGGRGDLLRSLRQPLRRGLVRRAVDQVACPVRPLGDRGRPRRGLFEAVRLAAQHERLDLRPLAFALPARGVVAAEHRSVHEGAGLLGGREREGLVDHPRDSLREVP
jgi:hypothetical protein